MSRKRLPEDLIKDAQLVERKLRKNIEPGTLTRALESGELSGDLANLLRQAIPQLTVRHRQRNNKGSSLETAQAIQRILDRMQIVHDEVAMTFGDLSNIAQKSKNRLVQELKKRLDTDDLQEVSVESLAMMLQNFDQRMHHAVLALFLFVSGAPVEDEDAQEFRLHLSGAIRNMSAAFLMCHRKDWLPWIQEKRYQQRLKHLQANVKARDFQGTIDVSQLKQQADAETDGDPFLTMRWQGSQLPEAAGPTPNLPKLEEAEGDHTKLYSRLFVATEVLLETDLPSNTVDEEGVLLAYQKLAAGRRDDVIKILDLISSRLVDVDLPSDDQERFKFRTRAFMAVHFLAVFPDLREQYQPLVDAIDQYVRREEAPETLSSDLFKKLQERSEKTTTVSISLPKLQSEGEVEATVFSFLEQVRRLSTSALSPAVQQRQLNRYLQDFLPQLANFRMVEVLGQGGLGIVVKVINNDDGREAAVKIILPHRDDEEEREQLREEAALASRIDHPNVVKVYDVLNVTDPREGTEFPMILSEYVEGNDAYETLIGPDGLFSRFPIVESAESMTKVECLPPRAVLLLFRELTAGLTAVHTAGLTHFDLKFENVMITQSVLDDLQQRLEANTENEEPFLTEADIIEAFEAAEPGWAKLTDFGIAAESGQPYPCMAGTLRYMSTNMLRDGSSGELVADPSQDMEALGKLLYEVLTLQSSVKAVEFRYLEQMQSRLEQLQEAVKSPQSDSARALIVQIAEEKDVSPEQVNLEQEITSLSFGLENHSSLSANLKSAEKLNYMAIVGGITAGSLISPNDPVLATLSRRIDVRLLAKLIEDCTRVETRERLSAATLLHQIESVLAHWEQFEEGKGPEQFVLTQGMIYALLAAAMIGAVTFYSVVNWLMEQQ